MLVTWGFYFKSVREGNDPHAENYTMPISFTGEKNNRNETIKIPENAETNNGQYLSLNNGLNIKNGHWLNMAGGINTGGINTDWENVNWLHVNHGDINIHNGHWMNVNGGGINTEGLNTNWQNVNWLNVNWGDINIKNGHGINTNWLNTNGINIKNKQYIGGMQFGWCDGNMPHREYGKSRNGLDVIENDYGWCSFNHPFDTDSVYIFTNRNGGDSYDTLWSHGSSRIGSTNIWGQNRHGFYFRTSYVNDKGWFSCYFSRGLYPFFWFAISG